MLVHGHAAHIISKLLLKSGLWTSSLGDDPNLLPTRCRLEKSLDPRGMGIVMVPSPWNNMCRYLA